MSADGWALAWFILFLAITFVVCMADALWRAWRQHRRQRDWRRVARPEWHTRRLTNGQWVVERRR